MLLVRLAGCLTWGYARTMHILGMHKESMLACSRIACCLSREDDSESGVRWVAQVDAAMDGGGEPARRPHEQVLLPVRPCQHEGACLGSPALPSLPPLLLYFRVSSHVGQAACLVPVLLAWAWVGKSQSVPLVRLALASHQCSQV